MPPEVSFELPDLPEPGSVSSDYGPEPPPAAGMAEPPVLSETSGAFPPPPGAAGISAQPAETPSLDTEFSYSTPGIQAVIPDLPDAGTEVPPLPEPLGGEPSGPAIPAWAPSLAGPASTPIGESLPVQWPKLELPELPDSGVDGASVTESGDTVEIVAGAQGFRIFGNESLLPGPLPEAGAAAGTGADRGGGDGWRYWDTPFGYNPPMI